MNAIIFGAGGQDGYYLEQICRSRGIDVIGVSLWGPARIRGDIADFAVVERIIAENKPDYVFHLAASSTTRHDALFENHSAISTGTINILEAVKRHSPASKVFITGSGVQFKNNGKPISEADEFEANSPYSVARIQSVYAARYYRSLGIRTYVGYLFHHESPFRDESHVSKMITNAVQRISSGSQEKITLGDLSVKKEWTFAGDTVEGMFTLVQQDEVFEAVIGSGVPYSIENWLEVCFGIIGRKWNDYVILREGFKSEYPLLVSNPFKIHQLGWSPKISFRQLAEIMINYSPQVKL
ncbi:MAG: GDP-mannose 4,6-dehydratase [Sedimentisphaerales bacterium]|jgi:GDPmannose 4,6-dehydratase